MKKKEILQTKNTLDGSTILNAIQTARTGNAVFKAWMSKNQEELKTKDIEAQYPDYRIEGKSQGKHEANHYITLTLVKDMLKDPVFAPKLAKIALDYQLDLTKASDFTFSGERIPLVLDTLFYNAVQGIKSDQYTTRWIEIDFSEFPFRRNEPIDEEKLQSILARDLKVNVALANDEEQREELNEEFYAQFIEPDIYQALLENPKLFLKVINSLRSYKTSIETGFLPSFLTQE
jgi:hypothetical protein